MPVIKRAEWTKIRDRNGVKAGLAKVSIGKTLDAYHAAKTVPDRIAKVKALLDAWSKYANELDMKVPGEQQLAREIGGIHIKAAKEALDNYEDLQKMLKDAASLDVNDIIKNRGMMKIFPAYVKKELNDENLDFILAVDKKVNKKKIYDDFIPQKASRQVNLPAPTRLKLEALAKDEDYDKMDFAQARREIADMMNRDTVRRFVNSKEFKDLMADMAGIDD
jgi:Regulator of G protein signaling domain.